MQTCPSGYRPWYSGCMCLPTHLLKQWGTFCHVLSGVSPVFITTWEHFPAFYCWVTDSLNPHSNYCKWLHPKLLEWPEITICKTKSLEYFLSPVHNLKMDSSAIKKSKFLALLEMFSRTTRSEKKQTNKQNPKSIIVFSPTWFHRMKRCDFYLYISKKRTVTSENFTQFATEHQHYCCCKKFGDIFVILDKAWN